MSLRASNLSVSFGGQRVLDGAHIEIAAGEIHGLAGSNGAGKSTLIRVLAGEYVPEPGAEIDVAGSAVGRQGLTADRARQLGIRVVHQEAPLVGTLTVGESIALQLGYPTARLGRVKWRDVRARADALLSRWGIQGNHDSLAHELSARDRSLVSIALALDESSGVSSRLLILDEPTAALSDSDAAAVLEAVASRAQEGVAVLFVTHRLAEFLTYTRNVTVLRDGRVTGSSKTSELTPEALVAQMVGEPVGHRSEPNASGEVSGFEEFWSRTARLRASAPSGPGGLSVSRVEGAELRGVSFEVGAGEIVGFAGLPGSGVNELPRLLAGVERRVGGTIAVGGEPVPFRMTPREALRLGIAFVPEDRVQEGGVRELSLRENLLLPQPRSMWHRRRAHQLFAGIVETLHIVPPSPNALLSSFSGGNQQKALVGKWLAVMPRVLILVQPTAGVDSATRAKLYEVLRAASSLGVAILLFSSELQELTALADGTPSSLSPRGLCRTATTDQERTPRALETMLQFQ